MRCWEMGLGVGQGHLYPLRVYPQWGSQTCASKVGKMEVTIVISQSETSSLRYKPSLQHPV